MIRRIYDKYKEIINYLIVGVLTTVVSLGVVLLLSYLPFCNPVVPWQLQLANIISWIAAVSFAYITNRAFVFESTTKNIGREAGAFFFVQSRDVADGYGNNVCNSDSLRNER